MGGIFIKLKSEKDVKDFLMWLEISLSAKVKAGQVTEVSFLPPEEPKRIPIDATGVEAEEFYPSRKPGVLTISI